MLVVIPLELDLVPWLRPTARPVVTAATSTATASHSASLVVLLMPPPAPAAAADSGACVGSSDLSLAERAGRLLLLSAGRAKDTLRDGGWLMGSSGRERAVKERASPGVPDPLLPEVPLPLGRGVDMLLAVTRGACC